MLNTTKHFFGSSLPNMAARPQRLRLYKTSLFLIAVSVPFLHIYLPTQLTMTELVIHTMHIVVSTAVGIVLLEFAAARYVRNRNLPVEWNPSFVMFWLSVIGVFLSCLLFANFSHEIIPLGATIWNKHLQQGLVASPLKLLPVALLVGYLLTHLIPRNNKTGRAAETKQVHTEDHPETPGRNASHCPSTIAIDTRFDCGQVILPYKGGILKLQAASIMRVIADENYCHVRVVTGQENAVESHMIRTTLTEIENQLADGPFLRVHRSHIVNDRYIEQLSRKQRNYQLRLSNGEHVPVSRSRVGQVRKKLTQSIKQCLR